MFSDRLWLPRTSINIHRANALLVVFVISANRALPSKLDAPLQQIWPHKASGSYCKVITHTEDKVDRRVTALVIAMLIANL